MSNLERLNVLVPSDVKAELKRQAEDKGLNLSSIIRLILTAEARNKK